MSKRIETEQEAIKLWKELGITSCTMDFSCGGDSMSDYSFEFYGDGKIVDSHELTEFIEEAVFNRVEFYEASDGHYMGEFGTVEITLIEEEDENPFLNYSKSSTSEYDEQITEFFVIHLTEEQENFLRSKVSRVSGGDSDATIFEYRNDCILFEAEIELRDLLIEELNDIARGYEFKYDNDNEPSDWYRWDMVIDDEPMKMGVTRTFIVHKDENY